MRYFPLVICVSGLLAIIVGLFGDALLFTPTSTALAQPPRPTLTSKPETKDDKDNDDDDNPTATPTATSEPPTATSEPPTATSEPPTATSEPPTATPAPLPQQLPNTGDADTSRWVLICLGILLLGSGLSMRSGRWNK